MKKFASTCAVIGAVGVLNLGDAVNAQGEVADQPRQNVHQLLDDNKSELAMKK